MSFISVNFSTLYFYKRNRKLSPTLKGTQTVHILRVCESFLPLTSCTCHKLINTNIYFCQLLSNVEFSQRERWDWDFSDCGRHTQTAGGKRIFKYFYQNSALTIGRLPINRPNRSIGSSLVTSPSSVAMFYGIARGKQYFRNITKLLIVIILW